MKKITRDFLRKQEACEDGYKWWCKNCEGLSNIEQIKKLAQHRFDWANWLIVRILNHKQRLQYAVFAAEQVIDIYEKKYPNDNRPRKAIEAAKKCIKRNSKYNIDAAYNAAAAVAAVYAAYADADYDACYASYYACAAAYTAYDAAYYADDAAYTAAYDAAACAVNVDNKYEKDIINYGIKLIEVKE